MIVIDLHYLPSISYMLLLLDEQKVMIEAEEHYVKQSMRNRSRILGANKIELLSVPVLGGGSSNKTKSGAIRIDYSQKWQNVHWRALESAYGKSPFFAYYKDYILDVYESKYERLFDLNLNLLTLCLKFLESDTQIVRTESYIQEYDADWTDLRGRIEPGGSVIKSFFQPKAYQQVFGKDFVQNLSIVDLLFNKGPESRKILKMCRIV